MYSRKWTSGKMKKRLQREEDEKFEKDFEDH